VASRWDALRPGAAEDLDQALERISVEVIAVGDERGLQRQLEVDVLGAEVHAADRDVAVLVDDLGRGLRGGLVSQLAKARLAKETSNPRRSPFACDPMDVPSDQ